MRAMARAGQKVVVAIHIVLDDVAIVIVMFELLWLECVMVDSGFLFKSCF